MREPRTVRACARAPLLDYARIHFAVTVVKRLSARAGSKVTRARARARNAGPLIRPCSRRYAIRQGSSVQTAGLELRASNAALFYLIVVHLMARNIGALCGTLASESIQSHDGVESERHDGRGRMLVGFV